MVLNKIDRLLPDEYAARREEIIARLEWTLPVYGISAMTGEGTAALMGDLMSRLEALAADRAAEQARAERDTGVDADSAGPETDWHPLD